jgi:hypothetical protein
MLTKCKKIMGKVSYSAVASLLLFGRNLAVYPNSLPNISLLPKQE